MYLSKKLKKKANLFQHGLSPKFSNFLFKVGTLFKKCICIIILFFRQHIISLFKSQAMEIHIYELKIRIKKFQMSVKFPCSIQFHYKDDKNIIEGVSIYHLLDGTCVTDQEFEAQVEVKRDHDKFQDKKILITGFMVTSHSKIPVGTASLKIVKNSKMCEYHDKQLTLRVEKCPDPKAQLNAIASLKFLSCCKKIEKQIKKHKPNLNKTVGAAFNTQNSQSEDSFCIKPIQFNHKISSPQSQISDSGKKKKIKSKRQFSSHKQLQQDIEDEYENTKKLKHELSHENFRKSGASLYDNSSKYLGVNASPSAAKILDLQKEKCENRKQIARLKGELSEIRQMSLKVAIEQKSQKYLEEINELNNNYAKVKQQKQKLAQSQKRHLHEAKILSKRVREAEKKLNLKEETFKQINGNLQQKDSQISSLKEKIRKQIQELQDIRLQKSLIEKRLNFKEESYQEELKKLGEKYQSSETQKQKMLIETNQILHKYQNSQRKFQGEMKEREVAILTEKNKLMKQIEQYRTKNKELQDLIKDLQAEITSKDHQLKMSSKPAQEIENLNKQIEKLDKNCQKVLQEKKKLESDERIWKESESNNKKRIGELEEENKKLRENIWEFKQNYLKGEKSLQAEKASGSIAIQKLNRKIEQLEQYHNKNKATLEDKLRILSGKYEDLKVEKNQLSNQLSKNLYDLNKTLRQKQMATTQLDFMKQQNQQLQIQLKQLKESLKEDSAESQKKLLANHQQLYKSLLQAKQKLHNAEKRIFELEKINENHLSEISALKSDKQNLLKEALGKNNLSDEEIKNLKKELNNRELAMIQLEGRVKYYEMKQKDLEESYNSKIQKLNSQIVQLEKKLSSKKGEHSEASEELDDLRRKLQRSVSEKKYLQEQIKNIVSKNEEVISEINREKNILETEVKKKDCVIEEQESKIKQLEAKAMKINEKNISLSKEYQQDFKLLNSTMNLNSEESLENQEYSSQEITYRYRNLFKQSLKFLSQERLTCKNHNEYRTLETLNQTKEKEAHDKIVLLQNEIQKRQEEWRQRESKVREEINTAHEQAHKLDIMKTKLQRKVTSQTQILQNLEQELKLMQNKMEEIYKSKRLSADEKQKEIDSLNETVMSLQKTIKKLQFDRSNIEQENKALKIRVSEMDKKLKNYENEGGVREEEIEKWRRKNKELKGELQNEREQIVGMKQKNKGYQNEIYELKEKIQMNEQNISKLQKQKKQLQFQKSDLSEQNTKTKLELTEKIKELIKLDSICVGLQNQKEQAVHHFQELEAIYQKVLKELESYKNMHMKQCEMTQLQASEKINANNQLKIEIEHLHQLIENKNNQINTLSERIGELQKLYQKQREEKQRQKQEKTEIFIQNESTQRELVQSKDKIAYLEDLIRHKIEQIDSLEKTIEEKQNLLRNLQSQINETKELVENLGKKSKEKEASLLKKYSSIIENLQREIQIYRKEAEKHQQCDELAQKLDKVKEEHENEKLALLMEIAHKDDILKQNMVLLNEKDKKIRQLASEIKQSLLKPQLNKERQQLQNPLLQNCSNFIKRVQAQSSHLKECSILYLNTRAQKIITVAEKTNY